jgi:hypothetical protein
MIYDFYKQKYGKYFLNKVYCITVKMLWNNSNEIQYLQININEYRGAFMYVPKEMDGIINEAKRKRDN